MYKVLIADDEVWIRKAIVKKVTSSRLDIVVAAEASDGQEALDLAVQVKPDIILTDIRMPYLNGLEFIEKIRQLLPAVKIIIISGYADFDYARCALQLKVSKYILKTIDDNNLENALEEVILEIEQNKRVNGEFDELREKLQNRTQVLQKNLIHQLLSGKVFDEDYLKRIMNNLDLQLNTSNHFNVLVVQLKEHLSEERLICFINDLDAHLDYNKYEYFVLENQLGYNEINILLFSSTKFDLSKLQMYCFSGELIEKFQNDIAFIGISDTNIDFTHLHRAYIQSLDAIKNKLILKDKRTQCLHFGDIQPSERLAEFFTIEDERSLTYYMESGNHTDIARHISLIFESMNTKAQISTKTLMKLYYECILLLENLLNRYNFSVEQVLGIDFLTLVNTPKTATADNIKESLTSYAIKVSEQISVSKKYDPKALLETIKSYIESNYFEDITLDTIAQRFYISKSYFSQLFKRELGINFINYLTNIRMTQAEQLLKNNNLKVQEVARMVGYSDPLYFGQVFKKYFKVLPSEYASA